jgi:hypothetical protein
MTLNDLRTHIRNHTVFDNTKITDTIADIFLGTAIDEMVNAHDWQLRQATTLSFTYGPTTDGIALPEGFIADQAVYQIDTTLAPDSQRTFVTRLDGGRVAWVGFTTGTNEMDPGAFPQPSVDTTYYYLWGNSLFVVPNPSNDTTFQLDYLQDLSTLTDTNPLIAFYPRTVLEGALREAYLWSHEEERAVVHEQRFRLLLDAAKKRDTGARMAGGGKRVRA